MFRSITLTDFQSHQSTHLPLGPFTVIVGSSSSGKSAVVRALRLVAENARGVSYVRQGAKTTRVALEIAGSEPVLDASTVVTVERGKTVSAYTLAVAGMHAEPVVFTKCASGVPDAVAAALEVGDSKLWVAGQFDRPFLLDETGAEVARVLGKLTNVNMIYSAVRETNRRASEARRTHTARSAELDEAARAIGKYASLPARLESGRTAEAGLGRAESLADRRARLAERLRELDEASARSVQARTGVRTVPDAAGMTRLSALRTRLADRLGDVRTASSRRSSVNVELRPVPDTGTFDSLLLRRASLRATLGSAASLAEVRSRLASQIRDAQVATETARVQFTEALKSAGSCPLCGAPAASAQIDNVL